MYVYYSEYIYCAGRQDSLPDGNDMRLPKPLRKHSAVMPARPGGRRYGGAASAVIFSTTNFPPFFSTRRFHSIYTAFQYSWAVGTTTHGYYIFPGPNLLNIYSLPLIKVTHRRKSTREEIAQSIYAINCNARTVVGMGRRACCLTPDLRYDYYRGT